MPNEVGPYPININIYNYWGISLVFLVFLQEESMNPPKSLYKHISPFPFIRVVINNLYKNGN